MSPINNEDVEKILNKAAPRIKPDEEIRNAVYQEVHKAWAQSTRKPFYQRHPYKIAASIALFASVLTILLLNNPLKAPNTVSHYVLIQGQVQRSTDGQQWTSFNESQTIQQGDYLKTLDKDRFKVTLHNGNQLRVDENTSLRFESEHQVLLYGGRIYIDSDQHGSNQKLTISTPLASINHIGTQYSVEYNDEHLEVNVREGMVAVSNDDSINSQLPQGQSFQLDQSGKISIGQVTTFDQTWEWTQLISGRYEINDKSLFEYLQWVSRETGLPIKWQSSLVKTRASEIILSGSIDGIKPIETMAVILPTTRYEYSLKDNQIYIFSGTR